MTGAAFGVLSAELVGELVPHTGLASGLASFTGLYAGQPGVDAARTHGEFFSMGEIAGSRV